MTLDSLREDGLSVLGRKVTFQTDVGTTDIKMERRRNLRSHYLSEEKMGIWRKIQPTVSALVASAIVIMQIPLRQQEEGPCQICISHQRMAILFDLIQWVPTVLVSAYLVIQTRDVRQTAKHGTHLEKQVNVYKHANNE